MIEISKISKHYQDITVLDNITTTIQRGGITSIIGPNGAGKSTLLSVIGRLLIPESGMVSVNGMDVAATDSDEINIASAQIAKVLFNVEKVVARIRDQEKIDLCEKYGIKTICPPSLSINEINRYLEV